LLFSEAVPSAEFELIGDAMRRPVLA